MRHGWGFLIAGLSAEGAEDGWGEILSAQIFVIGSLNFDLTAAARRIPAPGETVMAKSFATFPGGKGANQAVAAARLGARVSMIGAVGDDDFGTGLLKSLAADGVDTGSVAVIPGVSSGLAMITVSDDGENAITVVPGANGSFRPEQAAAGLQKAAESAMVGSEEDTPAYSAGGDEGRSTFAMFQLEITPEAVAAALAVGRRLGMKIMLDPAPAPPSDSPLPESLLKQVDVLVPNLGEARALVGDDSASPETCARTLAGMGAALVVVTLGAQGVVWVEGEKPDGIRHEPARPAIAVDSTAAGDSFAGALAVGLSEGMEPSQAIDLAQAAAAVTVTRRGAQPSLPSRAEVEAALQHR